MSVDRVESWVWELLAVVYQRIKSSCFVIQQVYRKVIMVNKIHLKLHISWFGWTVKQASYMSSLAQTICLIVVYLNILG